MLIEVENLKVTDVSTIYDIARIAPITCGNSPERIVVETRKRGDIGFVTYWYFWSYDRWPLDHEDWEPATLVYRNDRLERIDARVHDGLVSYIPSVVNGHVVLYFPAIGHTPVVRVKNRKKDVTLRRLNDGLDSTRKKWLNYCYRDASLKNWKVCSPPQLETRNGPILDVENWKKWGKHSIYLRL
jgi:hypothetical protein